MKTKPIHILIAAGLSLALVGNANAGIRDLFKRQDPQATEAQPQAEGEHEAARTDKRRLFKAGGIGCATGALMGLLTGNKKDAIRGCAIGAAVGGLASWQAQVDEAREVEAAAKAAGMKAEVRTEHATDDKGQTGQKLQALVIDYQPEDMQAMGPDTVAMLDRMAGLTTKAKNELTVRFEGTSACAIPRDELNRRGALDRHAVVDACGTGSHRIVISPIPDVR